MKYLISGGAGFIGSHLCDALIKRGDSVVCVDSMITGSVRNIWHMLSIEGFELISSDALGVRCGDIDGIFHLASPAAPADIRNYPSVTISVNRNATKYLLEYARSQSAKFLFVSTMKVHGNCERVESYIAGKRAGEEYCAEYGAKVARLASVFGPRMALKDSRVIPVFITRALRGQPLSLWNGGGQIDSFCYVSDIVRGIIDFMDSDESGVIEFGNPEGISIIDLAKTILHLTGSISEITTNENVTVVDECHRIPDLQRAKEALDWNLEVNLKEGLMRTVMDFIYRTEDKPCQKETTTISATV